MAIHGILHLLSYDHDDLESANKMEGIEIEFLKKIGVNNPYQGFNHQPSHLNFP